MYEDYYTLSGNPFRLTPDRRFWFGSESHRKAMSYLKYGLYQGEGFIVITGDVGTGKSTLVSQLFEELDSDDIIAATIGTTQVDAEEVIRLICDAYGLETAGRDKASLISLFQDFLVEQNQMGRRVLLVVDEAQNLPMRTLEELRMLSNFNIGGQPLFQSFLIGQPQFLRALQHPDLAQLQQRVIAQYRLESLSEQETGEYIVHRLEAVEWQGTPEFTPDAFVKIFAETKGVPRRVNTLCNRIMLFASLEELAVIDGAVVTNVIKDLEKEVQRGGRPGENETPVASVGGGVDAGKAEAALNAILKRLTAIETTLSEHDAAIRELIDISVTLLGEDPEADYAPERMVAGE